MSRIVRESLLAQPNEARTAPPPACVCLQYYDSVYVRQQQVTPVCQLSMELWRELVVRQPRIRESLMPVLLNQVHRERCGETADRGLMHATTQRDE